MDEVISVVLAIVLPVTDKPDPTVKLPLMPPKEVTPLLDIVVPDILIPSPEANKTVPDCPCRLVTIELVAVELGTAAILPLLTSRPAPSSTAPVRPPIELTTTPGELMLTNCVPL